MQRLAIPAMYSLHKSLLCSIYIISIINYYVPLMQLPQHQQLLQLELVPEDPHESTSTSEEISLDYARGLVRLELQRMGKSLYIPKQYMLWFTLI